MHRQQTARVKISRPTKSKRLKLKSPDTSAFEERLLTAGEVARILHVSRSLLYWLIRRGDLPTVHIHRMLRFRADDVQRYIKLHRRDPAGKPERRLEHVA